MFEDQEAAKMVRFSRSAVHVVLFYAIIAIILRPVWPAINNPRYFTTLRGSRCHHTKQQCSAWIDGYWRLKCINRCNCRGHRHGECIRSPSCTSLVPYMCKCIGGYSSEIKRNCIFSLW